MIVNLTGPIASGKSTLCKWFIARHPEWKHIDIAVARSNTLSENDAWIWMEDQVKQADECIVETTGVLHRLADLWRNVANKTAIIYTIKLVAPVSLCKQRAKLRNSYSSRYSLDEGYAIDMEERLHDILPANLVVDITADMGILDMVEEIEQYILKARFCSGYIDSKYVIGYNSLKKEEENVA